MKCSSSLALFFFLKIPSQETETTGQAPGGSEGGEGVTDVIQQLLELSEQVTEETSQPQPPEPPITIDTAINQDILQVSERCALVVVFKTVQNLQTKLIFNGVLIRSVSVASFRKQRAECCAAAG